MIENVGISDGVMVMVARAPVPFYASWEFWAAIIVILAGITAIYLKKRNGGRKEWKNEWHRVQYS